MEESEAEPVGVGELSRRSGLNALGRSPRQNTTKAWVQTYLEFVKVGRDPVLFVGEIDKLEESAWRRWSAAAVSLGLPGIGGSWEGGRSTGKAGRRIGWEGRAAHDIRGARIA